MSKTKKIIIGIIIVLLIVGFVPFTYKWVGQKIEKVKIGLAEPNFPYRDYTQEELNKMYPQIRYADVPTRITPEETYAKFRQALKENNLEMAVEQLSKESEKYEGNKSDLTQAYRENRFNELINDYPEKIWRGTFGESTGQLCYSQQYENKEFVGCSGFIKNADGDWKLDSL